MGNLRNRLLKILLILLALGAALFGGCILYLAITDPIKQPYRQYLIWAVLILKSRSNSRVRLQTNGAPEMVGGNVRCTLVR